MEPGRIEVLVGFSAADLVSAGAFEIVPGNAGDQVEKAFVGTVTVR